ncbi:MAG TPA: GntR family transcriptional regulator [Clostridia bacterium]|nr:GntR family transcriptional regulator [Clostridia bacterium]
MIRIDPRSSQPIYEQIVEKIKENIIRGILQPGDKLPSVRELSAILTINPNTVSKAYQELEREKTIETLRGRGTFVSQDYRPRLDASKMYEMEECLRKVAIEAHYMGIEKERVLSMLASIFEEVGRGEKHD